jgi:hypothetical protein
MGIFWEGVCFGIPDSCLLASIRIFRNLANLTWYGEHWVEGGDNTELLKIKGKIAGFHFLLRPKVLWYIELWEVLHPNIGSEKLHIQQDYLQELYRGRRG